MSSYDNVAKGVPMRILTVAMLTAGAAGLSPAVAQEGDYNGFYIGGSAGIGAQSNDGRNSSIEFDTNRDGVFGDTVRTGTGANAFSPGFCGGRAQGVLPVDGCTEDLDRPEYFGHIGADTQFGRIVVGVVGDFGKSESVDFVSAYSTTPARYSFSRRFKYNAGIRGRVGYTPNDSTLFYGTGGAAYAKIRNRFETSNGANSFTSNGNSDAWGYSVGGGVEQRIFRNFSVGLLYLNTTYEDDEARVLAGPGTAPATNPFLLVNGAGTDFRRSDDKFRMHSLRATASFRF